MVDYAFRKIKNKYDEPHLVIFEQGEFKKPILILEKDEVAKLNEEWNDSE